MNKYDAVYDVCPVCNSKNILHYHTDYRENKIFKCLSCGVQFMNPVYSDAYLEEYYSNYIPQELDQRLLAHQAEVINDNFRAINKFISKGRFLDFGTGDGTHAKYAKDKNWDAAGYDVDCSTMAKIKKEFDLDTYCGDFFEIDWGKGKFDLIYANQVIEHLKNPVDHLKYFYNLLDDGGYLFISVPNINSTSHRLKRFLEKLNVRKNNIGKYYDSDHHLIYYTPETIRQLLRESNFRVLYCRNCAKPGGSRSKLQQFVNKYINEKILSTSTFLLVAEKVKQS